MPAAAAIKQLGFVHFHPHQWAVCLLAQLLARSLARSEVGALSRLRQLLVGGRRHVPADLDQHGLHGEVALPGCYAGELG